LKYATNDRLQRQGEQFKIMRSLLVFAVVLNGALAMAQQPPSFQNLQRTSGVVGIAPGQTARLNVLYPTAPAPIFQTVCSASLAIADDQGKILKSNSVDQLIAGKSVSLDLNADTDLAGATRSQIHGFSVAPTGCQLITTLEIIDNFTQKTVLVVGSDLTYPLSLSVLLAMGEVDRVGWPPAMNRWL
jgi:hypothetical protein